MMETWQSETLLMIFAGLLFFGIAVIVFMFALTTSWIREMLGRYDRQAISDMSNVLDPFKMGSTAKISALLHMFILFSCTAVLITVVTKLGNLSAEVYVREQAAIVEEDAQSLRYLTRLYKMAGWRLITEGGMIDEIQPGSEERVQEASEAGGNGGENQKRLRADRLARGLHDY